MHGNKPSICFVAPNAYSIIARDTNIKIVGGAELQQSLLAKALVKKGYQVTMICMDHGQKDNLEIDGARIIKAYRPDAGIPGFRFFHPRLTSIWRSMKRANADIYIQSCAGMLTGVVTAFCKLNNKKSIFYAASDNDFIKVPYHIKYYRDLWLYQYGVKYADKILIQNSNQRLQCKLMYNRDSVQVPNIYALPESANNDPNGYILWVSTIRQLKRPELYVELAKSFPQYQFKMCGGVSSGEETLYDEIKIQADSLANFDFVGFVPYSQVDPYFDGARLVINTSDFEGFPNAFLQAWARKIPTVSFFDCGARADDKPVGFIVDSLAGMRNVVEKLMTDDEGWQANGVRCQAYFAENHSIEYAIDLYMDIFASTLNEP
jgi:glycosyltransferase involved in cell wall biosynthesis